MLQDWFYLFKNGFVARGHNPKLGIGGFLFAAKDWGVEKIHATLCVSFLFSQARLRKDRAHVDRDLALVDSAENSVGAKDNVLDGLVVTQTVHDQIDVANGVPWSIGDAGAVTGERFALLSASIPDGKFVSGFEKVGRHAAAHGPETEIRDCLHHKTLFSFPYLPGVDQSALRAELASQCLASLPCPNL